MFTLAEAAARAQTILADLKPLTEAEIWRLIAARIINAGRMPEGKGLCKELAMLYEQRLISINMLDDMRQRVDKHVNTHAWLRMAGNVEYDGGDVAWAYEGATHHEARALAALWMALEAEEEAQTRNRALQSTLASRDQSIAGY